LAGIPYVELLTALLMKEMGLSDFIPACERSGSLESTMRNAAQPHVSL
jgi:hypothetical protein